MANAIVTIKIMPESPETDLKALAEKTKVFMKEFSGKDEFKVEEKPVAFGIKSLNITFVMDEQLGSPEELEKKIAALDEVTSAETINVTRAVG
ncbi:MAG: elongation factor 1-beta [Candidatus Woesearchaeota archaeon]